MHWEILDPSRKSILPCLEFSRNFGFYLAGGTALSLQVGHRTSIDFDFYTKEPFNETLFEQNAVQNLKGLKVTQRAKGTLCGQINDIELSFFYYPYRLLNPPIVTEYLDLLSIPDIAAMKLIALSQRGLRRDFLDLYILSRQHGTVQIFQWTQEKFPQSDPHVYLKALTYFKDAEEDESGRGMELKEPVPWTKIKNYFEKEAIQLARSWL